MMDSAKKLDFVLKMTKHALEHVQHFDSGGTVLPQSTTVANGPSPTAASGAGASTQGSVASLPQFVASGVTNPIASAGTSAQNIGAAFTTQNQYQAQLAPTTQLNYAAPAGSAVENIGAGYNQNQALLRQQEGLSGTLENEIKGGGPNPAQAALNENTGANIAQAAALAAGTRGAGTNAGLVAQNAAAQGAATQQNSVGQAATLEAQQQLNEQQQLEAQQQAEVANVQGEQGVQGNVFGAAANANNSQNNSQIANYGMAQGINSQVSQNNANAVNKTTGGFLQGAGSALASLFAEGGKVPHLHHMAKIYYPHLYANGGTVDFGVANPGYPNLSLPNLVGASESGQDNKGLNAAGSAIGNAAGGYPDAAYAKGGGVAQKLKYGGKVPGKPKVSHDSYNNDTVTAKVSPGEVVIDLNTLHDPGKLGKMARFVAQNIERKKMGRAC